MAATSSQILLLSVLCIVLLAKPSHAFGAGNIGSTSKIEGQNWRHGDIEDTLLTILISRAAGGKKFSKLDVKRVYFGNWLRDYSQAVDVGTVKYVSAEAIRLILWVLGFMSFGYGTHEFEVTTERLGCYRPEEHIDNPKDYADNEDARQYDRRLRGPVDERKELGINQETGLKNYIASENLGITTSAELVRKLFRRSIELGRQYDRKKNEADLYEALRLLGTGCHCLEDFSAHSNYTELALIELGERDIFPHVGRSTQMRLKGARQPVFPIITGTFGGVDFLHSVMGEFDDKATQSEIQELESTLQNSQNGGGNTSALQSILSQIPSGIFGGEDQAGKADELKANATAHQMQNSRISPRQPEEWTQYLQDVQKQIYPILEWHDQIVKSITETVEKIPILPELIEQLQDQINIFVFSLIAPFVVPIIQQIKSELNAGSSEIIQSSVDKQHIVFGDDRSTDPTHSMLSKDHFSNVLNEPAGKVASQVLKWVVPQIIAAWDDEHIDIRRTNDRIIHGIFHHPALRAEGQDGVSDGRRAMFGVVEQWWREKSENEKQGLRGQLSRSGVEGGRNHKPGVVDHGHGCGKPLGTPTFGTAQSSGVLGGGAAAGVLGGLSQAMGGGNSGGYQQSSSNDLGNWAGEAVGGGALGAIVGGLAGGLGGDLLGGAFAEENKQSYGRQGYDQDGSYNQTVTQVGQQSGRYGQAQYSSTQHQDGGRREEYQRFEQGSGGRTGFGVQEVAETQPTYGGGYEQKTEVRRTHGGGQWKSEFRREEHTSGGGYREETKRYSSRKEKSDFDDEPTRYKPRREKSDDFGSDDDEKRYGEKKHYKKSSREFSHDSNKRNSYGQRGGDSCEYGGQTEESSYGALERDQGYGSEQRQEYGDGRQEYGGGRQQQRRSREYGQEISRYGGGGDFQQKRQSREYGQESTHSYGGGYQQESTQSCGEGQQRLSGGYGQESSNDQGEPGYGGRQDDSMPGGFGEERRDNDQDYGGRNPDYGEDDDENVYGERRGY